MANEYLIKGNAFFLNFEYEKSIEQYEKSLSLYKHYFIYENIGMAYEKLGEHEKSLYYYNAALKVKKDSVAIKRINHLNKKLAIEGEALSQVGIRVCLVRILGEDMPGLHDDSQTYDNLKFILENESKNSEITKVFLLNRIISKVKRDKYKKLIESKGCLVIDIPFNEEEYSKIGFYADDLPNISREKDKWEEVLENVAIRKLKNRYAMNNNGARNFAIKYGIDNNYDWVLPFDGNCYMTEGQLDKLLEDLKGKNRDKKYSIIKMQRLKSNEELLSDAIIEDFSEEPQIAFNSSAKHFFSEDRVYGNQPKVELLKVLGVPGKWDEWKMEYPWKPMKIRSIDEIKGDYEYASSVFRLSSGNLAATEKSTSRAHIRAKAIIEKIDKIDHYLKEKELNESITDFYFYEKANSNYFINSNKVRVNDFFDHVYVVNLKSHEEECLKVTHQLNNIGIDFSVYNAVNGYKKEYVEWYRDYINKPKGKFNYFKEFEYLEEKRSSRLLESPGAVGYIETYTKIIKNAKYNGYKRILILEDDVILCSNFNDRFSSFCNRIPLDWKILHLGCSQYGWKSVDLFYSLRTGYYYPRIHDTKGSFAIAFDESVYDEILENQKHKDAPFDHIPIGVSYEKHLKKCFVSFPYLVMPDVSSSSIRGGRDQHEHANRMKWWLGDFTYPMEKLNVGVIVKDATSLKNLEELKKKMPFQLSPLIRNENGLAPFHNDTQLNIKEININNTKIDGNILSYDCLYAIERLSVKNIENLKLQIFRDVANKTDFSFDEIAENISIERYVEGRVSVILPTYKRPSFLYKAAVSVLEQDYSDIELVIVDDNGVGTEFSKETEDLVYKIKEEYFDKNIKYIQHQVNANGASARNSGIFNSTGEYISFIDDDDFYMPRRISSSIELLKLSNNDIGAVYCGFLGWNSPDNDLNRYAEGNLSLELLTLDYKKHYLHTNTATYKRTAIFRLNGFDPSYRRHQDLEFNLRFFEHYKILSVKEVQVRLSPEKSDVDNKVYNLDMLDLKVKFLKRFLHIIDLYDEDLKDKIIKCHYAEAVKYLKNESIKEKINFNLFKKHIYDFDSIEFSIDSNN